MYGTFSFPGFFLQLLANTLNPFLFEPRFRMSLPFPFSPLAPPPRFLQWFPPSPPLLPPPTLFCTIPPLPFLFPFYIWVLHFWEVVIRCRRGGGGAKNGLPIQIQRREKEEESDFSSFPIREMVVVVSFLQPDPIWLLFSSFSQILLHLRCTSFFLSFYSFLRQIRYRDWTRIHKKKREEKDWNPYLLLRIKSEASRPPITIKR